MKTLQFPPSIDWELTSACNHNCIHCYNYWRKDTSVCMHTMDEEAYLKIANRIIESHPVSVQITGGEPLIVWKSVRKAISRLLEADINVSINTNATLVTPEIAEFFGLNHIDAFVSFPCHIPKIFDYIVNKDGAFQKACQGIHLLQDAGVRVSLNMVVTKLNKDYIYDTAQYIKTEFDARYFSATKASFPQNADENFRSQMLSCDEFNDMLNTMLQVKQKLGMRVDSAWVYSLCGFVDPDVREQFGFNRKCICGKYGFVVDAQGDIKACGCDSRAFGNILDTSFGDAIADMRMWQDGSLLPETCRNCRWLAYCGGGCRSDAYSTYNEQCMPDSTANFKQSTCYLAPKGKREYKIMDERETFHIAPDVKFLEDGDLVRISKKTNFDFISKDFSDFLQRNLQFTVGHLSKMSGRDIDEVSVCLERLERKHFLCRVKSDVAAEEVLCEKAFQLLASPYVSTNTPAWIESYAGFSFSNIRHS